METGLHRGYRGTLRSLGWPWSSLLSLWEGRLEYGHRDNRVMTQGRRPSASRGGSSAGGARPTHACPQPPGRGGERIPDVGAATLPVADQHSPSPAHRPCPPHSSPPLQNGMTMCPPQGLRRGRESGKAEGPGRLALALHMSPSPSMHSPTAKASRAPPAHGFQTRLAQVSPTRAPAPAAQKRGEEGPGSTSSLGR